MKVIFLDFDGPMVPLQSYPPGEFTRMPDAHPPCITALNRITDTTGAKIVVSSTWRFGGLDYVREKLQKWGATAEVIDVTPVLRTIRGQEIGDWLLHHLDVTDWVILDDDRDMGSMMRYLVLTPFDGGLTEELADKAIHILTEGPDAEAQSQAA